jgi:hypothetical protein
MSGQLHVPAALILGTELRFLLNRKLGPQGQCGSFERTENPLVLTGNRNKISRSSSLQPRHYTDRAKPTFRHGWIRLEWSAYCLAQLITPRTYYQLPPLAINKRQCTYNVTLGSVRVNILQCKHSNAFLVFWCWVTRHCQKYKNTECCTNMLLW